MSSFPPSVPPNPPQAQPANPYTSVTSNISIAALVICPLLAILPPRKLDLYTFSLGAAWVVAANHQTQLRTGNGILLNLYSRQREREEQQARQKTWEKWEADESGARGLAKKVWMGDEKGDWKRKRMQEERDAVAEGKGIGDVIIDQVKEVWGVPKDEDEEDDNGDSNKVDPKK